MRKALALMLIILLPTLLAAQMKPMSKSQPLVLNNVTVIDMTGVKPKSNMTVVVKGNQISAIGKTGDRPNNYSAIPARIAARTKIELETYDEEKAKRLFASFVKNETWQVPTLATKKPLSLVDDGTFFNDARMKYITPAELENWKPENNFFSQISHAGIYRGEEKTLSKGT